MGFFLFLLYLALTFLRPAELYPQLEPLHIMQIASVLAIAGAVLGMLGSRGPTLRAPQLYLVPLFILWAAFSVMVTEHWLGGFLTVIQDFRASGLVFLLIVLSVNSLRRFRITLAVLAALGVLIVGEGLAAYHYGWRSDIFVLSEPLDDEGQLSESTDRFGSAEEEPDDQTAPAGPTLLRMRSLGFLNDPNDLAQAFVVLLPLVIVLRSPENRLKNLLLVWLPAGLLAYGVLLTHSRGGLLALLAIVFFAFRKRVGRLLSLVLSIAAALVLLALGATGGRALSQDESGAGRIAAWSEGLDMLKSSPIWGVGFGAFTEHHEHVAHNSFVHCFAELGLVGYFVWLTVIALTWTEVSTLAAETAGVPGRSIVPYARAMRLAMVGFIVGAFFLSRGYGVMFFLVLGLGTALGDIARREGQITLPSHPLLWIGRVGVFEVASIVLAWLTVRIFR
jgi:putative inorganic carbon (HCO3(-)) transporter